MQCGQSTGAPQRHMYSLSYSTCRFLGLLSSIAPLVAMLTPYPEKGNRTAPVFFLAWQGIVQEVAALSRVYVVWRFFGNIADKMHGCCSPWMSLQTNMFGTVTCWGYGNDTETNSTDIKFSDVLFIPYQSSGRQVAGATPRQ